MFPKRLKALAEMIISGEVTADIGADHGGLARLLVEQKLAPLVIATELGDGPYRRLRAGVAASTCRELIEVRQGNGLTVIEPHETVNVVMAGLGGEAMVNILAYDYSKACSFKRFIFQPMSRPWVLRRQLSGWGWPILEERLIAENGRLFVALSACPGHIPYVLSPLEIDIGPGLLYSRDEHIRGYLESHLKRYKNILSSRHDRDAALDEYRDKIRELEAMLK